MRPHTTYSAMLAPFILLASAPLGVLAGDVLKTNGYSSCLTGTPDIKVNKLDITFDRSTKKVVFDVSGTNEKEQKVMATLVVNAYGKEVYKKEFDPCDEGTKVEQLCPVPSGTFGARGEQSVPDQYLSAIPSIAFSVPDIDSQATMKLTAKDGGQDLACITSQVSNGQSLSTAGVQYIAAGIAGAALVVTGLASLAGAGQAGAPSSSPTFTDVIGWFQGMALNGMMSADVPGVYRNWATNFGFSTGLIYWDGMQVSIDDFRANTGGNLTQNSVEFLKNATLVHVNQNMTLTKRAVNMFLRARDDLNVDQSDNTNSTEGESKFLHEVKGVQGFVEQYTVPNGNAFMTVLLIFAIVIAVITVGILLFKVILETWALFGSFPKKLTGFRKRYWWTLAKTITNLILLLYGIWVLYCVYQFKNGDSWGAKTLAGVTLAAFTGVLVFFTWKIWSTANKFKKMEGKPDALYDNKEVWRKYSMFYENYKKSYWWIFVPAIVYMFARGCVIAGADGHGLAQAAGQLIVEALLLITLLWTRPYSLKSGNVINIIIQVVRVLSVICILLFVEELGMTQTTKTVTGLVLVVVQASLTGVLAILIAVNAIIICCKENPHRKKRKEAEKARDLDNLTPLDARNSLLMDPQEYKRTSLPSPFGPRTVGYDRVPLAEQHTAYTGPGGRQFSDDQGHLLADASTFGRAPSHDRSPSRERDDVEYGYAQPPGYGPVAGGAPWQPGMQQTGPPGKGGYAY
ncbi:TRP-domain-containing protein [Plenodomus tracheiphilus IPT5]|uniref:TRP-domain-containing protein n=1 Tax=Plenodomus tracheiphilus IPT5 TaxID=1408161 RepID=A0A6A7AYD0_9PLEO|nr:TRP-domain-containing protein [Plenodomus tracheiphilus IPT5]